MSINTKKIGTLLQSLNDVEYRFLRLSLGVVDQIKDLIKDYNLDKETFCIKFQITHKDYPKYISGNWNYSVEDIAKLHAIQMEYKIEQLKKQMDKEKAITFRTDKPKAHN